MTREDEREQYSGSNVVWEHDHDIRDMRILLSVCYNNIETTITLHSKMDDDKGYKTMYKDRRWRLSSLVIIIIIDDKQA
jgi:hypothetical protein